MDSVVRENPKITVLMPVNNCAQYIEEAVESVLNQTFKDFEFLIIDDASTDNTVSIIKRYSDSRIILIQKSKNTGLTSNLNYGISIARGKFIARMDGDDISLPERFEKQINYLENHPEVVVCGTDYKIIGTDVIKNVPNNHEDIKVKLLYGSCICHPTVMIQNSILYENNITYNIKLEIAQDYNLWVKLLQYGRLHNLSDVLLDYRIHPKQLSKINRLSQQLNGIDTKFLLLKNLDIKFDLKEQDIIKRIFISIKLEKEILNYKEIIFFVNKIKQKLIQGNKSRFFNENGFDKYLNYLQNIIIKDYFFYREKYKPIIFIHYITFNKKYNFRLSFINEIKLLIKSLVFYKKDITLNRD